MAQVTIPTEAKFTTVEEVQIKWNFKELNIRGGKLISFEAVGTADKHKTNGVFERDENAPFGKGNLVLKLDNGGTNTAWINGVKVKISFSRDDD